MGGQDGSRGYLYQAFASILEAIEYKYWNKIFVEFKSDNDKIDIALEFDTKIIKTIQVKSSINLFQKANIINWLTDLINDYPSEEYELYLIGSCDRAANILVKSLEKYFDGVEDKESKNALKEVDPKLLKNRISIKIIPFEIKTLESIVRDSLNRYISQKGCTIDYEGLDLIAKGVGLTFMLLSTQGQSISKEEFDKKIFNWLNSTLGSYLKNPNLKSKHEIMFYDKYKQEFSKSTFELRMMDFHGYKSLADISIKTINELVKEIRRIELPTFEKDENETTDIVADKDNDLTRFFTNIGSALAGQKKYKYLEFDDERKQDYIKRLKEYIGLDLDESFFYVGNLKEVQTSDFMNNHTTELIGNEDEIKKYKYIDELEKLLFDYELLNIFINEMKHCSIIPLVIKNTSEVPDHDLKIKIFIPKSVNIYDSMKYPANNYIRALPKVFAEPDGIIEKVFTITSDSKVSVENKAVAYDPRDFKIPMPTMFSHNYDDGYTLEDFYRVLERNIGQTIHYDDSNYYVIEYDIDKLYPKEIKALQNILVIYSLDNDIEIKYKILSPNSDGSIEGELNLKKHKEPEI